MIRELEKVYPILDVEHDCILSVQGDITIAFRAVLPEVFTLSNDNYEALHQGLIKAIKILPKHCVFHKQDWFTSKGFAPDFENNDLSFLSRSSDRFFNERPYLNHRCLIMLTKKAVHRRESSSALFGVNQGQPGA